MLPAASNGHREPAATSRGASRSAGSILATRTSLRSSSPKPRPKIRIPPVAVVAEIMGSVTTASRTFVPNLSEPSTTTIVPAESTTPHPKTEAKVSAAMKSRALLRTRRL
jgi:hypothetical protein